MRVQDFCVMGHNHTEMPDEYVAKGEAAERLLEAGFKQKKCLGCGLYSLWYRPSGRRLMRYQNVSVKIQGSGQAMQATERRERPIYPYVWAWGKYPQTEWRDKKPWQDLRKGQRCRVLVRGHRMNSALIEFDDGYKMVSSRNGLRKGTA